MSNINRWNKFKVSFDDIRHMYYGKEMTIPAIAKHLGTSYDVVKKMFKDVNIKKRDNDRLIGAQSKLKKINFTKNFISLINGCLLGDGCIANKTNCQAYYQHTDCHKDYILYLKEQFEKENIDINIHYNKPKIDKRMVRYNESWTLRSKSYVSFLEIYKLWYQPIKCIPKNLLLDKITLLHWWIGDGYLNKENGWGTIASHSFSFEDNLNMKNQFKNITNNYIAIYKNKKCDSFYLYISRKALNDILNYIGSFPVETYKYKWSIEC